MRFQPVLSDVDDTLIDSAGIQRWAWEIWAKGHRLDPDPFISGHGQRIEDKLERFAPHLSAPAEVERIAGIVSTCGMRPRALPGAAELLSTTSALALVTSGARRVVLPMLYRARLMPPQVIVPAEDVTRGKPDPEPYLTAAALLNVEPADCIVLEDAVAGVEAGVAAGMTVVAVTTTTPADDLRAAGAHCVVANVGVFLRRRELGPI